MEASYLENKILNLQAKLKAENEVSQRENLTIDALCSPRHGSGRRPKQLGDMGTPTRTRKQLDLPVSVLMQPKVQDNTEVDSKMKEIMKMNGILSINGRQYYTDIKDLEHLGELGYGTCGHVVKMLHRPSRTIIAVKQMRRSGNSDENKRIIMDLDVVFKSLDCPYIVSYLGCFITESDVWICMELMATCFDRLLKKLRAPIPEDILGKVTLATVKALNYLKESHGIIHRDVKPSNILLDEKGNVKLCDFGISGRLVDSKARTKNAGCAAYMAPERIEPPDPRKPDYDIRADVWSLGITLVELATGVFPYKDCKCDFEVLSRVLNEDPPSLPVDPSRFTSEFQSFVSSCLTKDYCGRPKYKKLLEHPFLKRYEIKPVDVAYWYAKAISIPSENPILRFTPTSLSTATRRQPPPPPLAPPIHHSRRMFFENGSSILMNGDQVDYQRYSPIHKPTTISNVHHLNGSPSSLQQDNYYPNYNGNIYANSPVLPRRRYNNTDSLTNNSQNNDINYFNNNKHNINYGSNYNKNNNISNNHEIINSILMDKQSSIGTENSSPLVLQRFQHQKNQHLNFIGSYPQKYNRSASLSPSRRYITESIKWPNENLIENSPPIVVNGSSTKKRFSSYLKFHLGLNDHNSRNNSSRRSPPTPPMRHASPSPTPPSPPPRLNRIPSFGSSSSSSSNAVAPPSPLMYRPNYFIENSNSPSPVRRILNNESSPSPVRRMLNNEPSPSLPRRYICPVPPQPPPRKLSESSSVPGSPQHMFYRRNDAFRSSGNKYQYTPQPQRKIIYQNNDL